MKEYTEYTDEELVELLRQGDTEVMDYLLEKYKFVVRRKPVFSILQEEKRMI